MLNEFAVIMALMLTAAPAAAQVSIGVSMPNLSIGINLPVYPQLVAVPGYPVYYAPQVDTNYFFYDGLYWVYQDDVWYSSDWYNGPWSAVPPEFVPLFVLRVPVRYYRQPPMYFRAWERDAPPRWDEHWGHEWAERRHGWNRWDRTAVPPPAPLPRYQRDYSGARYPARPQQQMLHEQKYHYQPRDPEVRQLPQQQPLAPATAEPARGNRPENNRSEHNRSESNRPEGGRPHGEQRAPMPPERPRAAAPAMPPTPVYARPATPQAQQAPQSPQAPEHATAPRPASPLPHAESPRAPGRDAAIAPHGNAPRVTESMPPRQAEPPPAPRPPQSRGQEREFERDGSDGRSNRGNGGNRGSQGGHDEGRDENRGQEQRR